MSKYVLPYARAFLIFPVLKGTKGNQMPVHRRQIAQVILLLTAVIFCMTPIVSYYQPSHKLHVQKDFRLEAATSEDGLDASVQPVYKIKPLSSELFTLSGIRLDIKRALSGAYATETVFLPHEIVRTAHYFRAPPSSLLS